LFIFLSVAFCQLYRYNNDWIGLNIEEEFFAAVKKGNDNNKHISSVHENVCSISKRNKSCFFGFWKKKVLKT